MQAARQPILSQHLHVQVLARLDEASQEQPPVKFLVAVMSACCTTLVRASERRCA